MSENDKDIPLICQDCGKSSINNVVFEVIGSICAEHKSIYGGVIGQNVVKGDKERWEGFRKGDPIVSDDGSLRVYRMSFCKKCLLTHILRTR